MPEVSVIIPCRNARPWVEQAINSALEQTWADLEVIVVDDGSTDDSAQAIQAIPDSRVSLVRQNNAGASAARNRGVSVAKGQYLQFLDADDLLHPRKIERQLREISQHKSDYVASGRWGRFFGDTTARAVFVPDRLQRSMSGPEFVRTALGQGLMMHPAAWLIPRDLAETAGPWDEALSLNDDGEYFARVVMKSAGIINCPEAISYYRSGMTGSLSWSADCRAWKSAKRALNSMAQGLLEKDHSLEARQAAGAAWSRLAVEAYPKDRTVVNYATQQARSLGFYRPMVSGGAPLQAIGRMLGWKIARRIQSAVYRMGYQRWRLVQIRRRASI